MNYSLATIAIIGCTKYSRNIPQYKNKFSLNLKSIHDYDLINIYQKREFIAGFVHQSLVTKWVFNIIFDIEIIPMLPF